MTTIDTTALSKRKRRLPLAQVRGASFNPPIRTANRTGDIDDLGAAIRDEGQLEAIHVVAFGPEDFVIADGHRRVSGLRGIGDTHVDAIVYDPGQYLPDEVLGALFVKLNGHKRRLANRDQVEVGVAGGPIFSPSVKSTVGQLQALFPNGIPTIVKECAGTHILSVAKRVVRYAYGNLTELQERRHVANALLWLIRNRQQQKAVAYMRLSYSKDAMKRAIEGNRVLPRVNVKDEETVSP